MTSCCVCDEPGTLASPSGNPESIYCEKHGHCSRCKRSIETFVKYPYGEFYACPCVVAVAKQIESKQKLMQAKQVALL